MNFFRTIAAAFSMFSVIPMPRIDWNEKTMRYMLCAFPLVGAAAGLALWGWCALSAWLDLGRLLFAAGMALIPVAVTGGIHLDGFMDTLDALSSHADAEKRRAILKDPHTGAFAVIGVCCYFLAYTALLSELEPSGRLALMLGLMHALSRALSAVCVLSFPGNGAAGLVSSFRELADKRGAAILAAVEAVIVCSGLIYLSPLRGGLMGVSALGCAAWLYFVSRRKFGGMSGDLAGWFLQTAELSMLAVYVLIERITAL